MTASVPFLGKHLNLVTHPVYSCPACHVLEPMHVHEHAVRWMCGHTRPLPPLPVGQGKKQQHGRKAA